jgi:hypothetical protein
VYGNLKALVFGSAPPKEMAHGSRAAQQPLMGWLPSEIAVSLLSRFLIHILAFSDFAKKKRLSYPKSANLHKYRRYLSRDVYGGKPLSSQAPTFP